MSPGAAQPTPAAAEALRHTAADILREMTYRLEACDSSRTQTPASQGPPQSGNGPGWHPLSLAAGLPAVALPSAVLAHTAGDARHAAHVHQRLRQAAAHPRPRTEGLFLGTPALAFTARVARGTGHNYSRLLDTADRRVAGLADRICSTDAPRLAQAEPAVSIATYDVISGLAGLGRYLLAAPAEHRNTLDRVLRHLVRLAHPLRVHGRRAPGWWTRDPGNHPGARTTDGHADLGMAHGIAGPLALLSHAWSLGIRVPGHREALYEIGRWLVEYCAEDAIGPYWPRTVDLTAHTRPTRGRAGWCYGAGTAAALRLAGKALDRPDWLALAHEALLTSVRSELSTPTVPGLCHGTAGQLALATVIGRQDDEPRLNALADRLASELCSLRHPQRAFVLCDDPGFLNGAAGTALALNSWLGPPARSLPAAEPLTWEAALLVD